MWIARDKHVKTLDGRKVYAVQFGKKFEIRITSDLKKRLCPKIIRDKYIGYVAIYFLTKIVIFDYRRHIGYDAC